jgi:hypothetical protein
VAGPRLSSCAWDPALQERIDAVRKKELALVFRTRLFSSFMSAMLLAQPVFVTVAVFGTYAAAGYELSASVIMPALSLLSMLRFPLAFLPMMILNLINMKVSFGRIKTFLMNDEVRRSLCVRTSARRCRLAAARGSDPMQQQPPTWSAVRASHLAGLAKCDARRHLCNAYDRHHAHHVHLSQRRARGACGRIHTLARHV